MNGKILKIILIIALIGMLNGRDFAMSRSLYIGDQVVLKIEGTNLSEGEITKAFDGFKLIAIEAIKEGYKVSVSPMTIGKQEVVLGNQQLIFDVHSTLVDIERQDIFEKDLNVPNYLSKKSIYIMLGLSGMILVLSNLIWLYQRNKSNIPIELTVFEEFIKSCEGLSTNDKCTLGVLTRASKVYLSRQLKAPLIGLTTNQLIVSPDIKLIESLFIDAYFDWLKECDDLKYKNRAVSQEELVNMKKVLIDIVKGLENYFNSQEGQVEEHAL